MVARENPREWHCELCMRGCAIREAELSVVAILVCYGTAVNSSIKYIDSYSSI